MYILRTYSRSKLHDTIVLQIFARVKHIFDSRFRFSHLPGRSNNNTSIPDLSLTLKNHKSISERFPTHILHLRDVMHLRHVT